MGNAYCPSDRVSPRGGVAVITASGYVTAVDIAVREVYIQAASANASVAYLRIDAVAAASTGFEIPKAVGTAAVANSPFSLPVSSLSCLYVYMAEATDKVQILYRN